MLLGKIEVIFVTGRFDITDSAVDTSSICKAVQTVSTRTIVTTNYSLSRTTDQNPCIILYTLD